MREACQQRNFGKASSSHHFFLAAEGREKVLHVRVGEGADSKIDFLHSLIKSLLLVSMILIPGQAL